MLYFQWKRFFWNFLVFCVLHFLFSNITKNRNIWKIEVKHLQQSSEPGLKGHCLSSHSEAFLTFADFRVPVNSLRHWCWCWDQPLGNRTFKLYYTVGVVFPVRKWSQENNLGSYKLSPFHLQVARRISLRTSTIPLCLLSNVRHEQT